MVRKLTPRLGGAFLFILFLYLACSAGGSGISKKEKEAFINTYVELTLAQAKYGTRQREYDIAVKNIYTQNNTSPEIMKEDLQKIAGNPQLQHDIYNAIAEKLKNIEDIPPDSLNKVLKPLLSQP